MNSIGLSAGKSTGQSYAQIKKTMWKDLKFPLLLGAVVVAMILDFRLTERSGLLLFIMAAAFPAVVIWLTVRVLKSTSTTKRPGFSDEKPETWYEQ